MLVHPASIEVSGAHTWGAPGTQKVRGPHPNQPLRRKAHRPDLLKRHTEVLLLLLLLLLLLQVIVSGVPHKHPCSRVPPDGRHSTPPRGVQEVWGVVRSHLKLRIVVSMAEKMWRESWHERSVGEAHSRVVMRCRRRQPRRFGKYARLLLLLLLHLLLRLHLLLLLSSEGVSFRLYSGALHREVAPWSGRWRFIR